MAAARPTLFTLAAGLLNPDQITMLLLAIGILLGLAKVLGELCRQFGQPAVLGEIMAGVLVGQTVLGQLAPDFYAAVFPEYGPIAIALEGLIVLAAVMLLLIAGLEVDLATALKQGKATVYVSLAGMVIPFGIGFVLAWFFPDWIGFEADPATKLPFALFVGIALSITALPVIAKILMDLNMAKSDIGVLIMSSAMVNDLVGWIGFAIVLSMVSSAATLGVGDTGGTGAAEQVMASAAETAEQIEGGSPAEVAEAGKDAGKSSGATGVVVTVTLTLAFIAVMLTVGRVAAHKALPWVQAHWSWPGGALMFVMVVALLCASFTEWLGVHSIFGAFIAGVAIGDSRHLRERTRETIHAFIANVFAPLFFASIALRVNFVDSFDWDLVLLVCVVAIIGKSVGCWMGARLAKLPNREAWAVGWGMVARGAMEIILAQLAFQAGLIGERLFVAIVVMALVTSLISGPAMEWVLKRKQKRKLSDMVNEKRYEHRLNVTSAREAIEALSRLAAAALNIPAEQIAQAVWDREQVVHTGIGKGVAVPHARLHNIDAPCVVIGRDFEGVDFDAPDGRPAQVICLLLSPADSETDQLEMLDAVARTFHDPGTLEQVLEAENYTEFLAALSLANQTEEHG